MSTTETKPRYIQLSDALRSRIQNGEWEIGDRLPSFTEIHHKHGAATATIQKAYDVLEKEGFVERRHRSGIYVKNPPVTVTRTIAYVVPAGIGIEGYGSSFYSMKLLRGTHREAASRGYHLTLCDINQLGGSSLPANGYIVQGNARHIQYCASFGKPVVSLITDFPGVPAVSTDDILDFEIVTQYLIDQGHRRISIVISNDDVRSHCPKRLQGYSRALKKNGIPLNEDWQCRLMHLDSVDYAKAGYYDMRQWLRDGWGDLGCTAIITQNDSTAIGVIKALRQFGYRVPEDVSVTGYDNSGEDMHFDLKLTTMHVPLEDIAQKSIEILNELITNPTTSIEILRLPTRLVIGESTMKCKGGN